MPRASKRTKKDKKKPIEIRYEPSVGEVQANEIDNNCFGFTIGDKYHCFNKKYLSPLIDELVRLEKAMHYEKVINNAVHK